ncbi:MAG: aminotransferase class I/II-fold pyridoxal phosphate-dependent enzyme [Pirellulales bacterium]
MSHTRLALHGGPATIVEGPPAWPIHDPAVVEAVEKALADGSWGRYHGPHGARLASAIGEMLQARFVWPCCSGTFAVELALRSLGIGPGHEVVLAGYDFPGNFRAIEAVGARPVLVDVRPDDFNLDVGRLDDALGEQTRAIVASHLHGGLLPMRELAEVARRHNLAIVEDACQAPGAVVEGRPAGTWGDVGVLSFGGSKLLTAGRGGALLTDRADVYQRAKIYCEQGNNAFPLSELQAAALVPQLTALAERNARRFDAARQLGGLLCDVPGLRALEPLADSTPAYYKLGFAYLGDQLQGQTREEFAAAVQAEGVALDVGFRGFALRGGRARIAGQLVHSRRAAETCLVLHHPVLLEPPRVIEQVAAAIRKVAAAFKAGNV